MFQHRGSKKNIAGGISQIEQGEQERLNLSKEVGQVAEKLIELSLKLEETEEKRVGSMKEIISCNREEKITKIEEINKKLENNSKEIKEAKRNVNNLKDKLGTKNQELSDKIKDDKKKLKEKKKSCVTKIESGFIR